MQNVFVFFEGGAGVVNKVYYGLRENGELQPKLLHTIKSNYL